MERYESKTAWRTSCPTTKWGKGGGPARATTQRGRNAIDCTPTDTVDDRAVLKGEKKGSQRQQKRTRGRRDALSFMGKT